MSSTHVSTPLDVLNLQLIIQDIFQVNYRVSDYKGWVSFMIILNRKITLIHDNGINQCRIYPCSLLLFAMGK